MEYYLIFHKVVILMVECILPTDGPQLGKRGEHLDFRPLYMDVQATTPLVLGVTYYKFINMIKEENLKNICVNLAG